MDGWRRRQKRKGGMDRQEGRTGSCQAGEGARQAGRQVGRWPPASAGQGRSQPDRRREGRHHHSIGRHWAQSDRKEPPTQSQSRLGKARSLVEAPHLAASSEEKCSH